MDAAAIAAGTPSFTLMRAAGAAATRLICERYQMELGGGCLLLAGPGNNGGDAWVVAAELKAVGVDVTVVEVEPPRTDDARLAKARYDGRVVGLADALAPASGTPPVVVDGLLGTGATGAPRDAIASAIAAIDGWRAEGARIVAMDAPSGVDATTGAMPGAYVRADLTITFGTVKRGLLRQRDASGAIVAVDIGLGAAAESGGLPLVTPTSALAAVPSIPAGVNKGTRRRVLVIGGAVGMGGAAILAARGALRSGAGMVKLCVEPASIAPAQSAVPAALTTPWPLDEPALADTLGWAHAVLLGPGLGLSRAARELTERVLAAWRGPVVVDADALNAFEGNAERLGELLKGRPAVVTPHPVEAQRLAGTTASDIDAGRFEAAALLAQRVRATVLLKGVPTVVADAHRTMVVASGTPVLATGGSGDVLGGIVATLLAQTGDALAAATSGAWAHGRAAEIAGAGRIRGVNLDDVVEALAQAWHLPPRTAAGVLIDLPSVGTR